MRAPLALSAVCLVLVMAAALGVAACASSSSSLGHEELPTAVPGDFAFVAAYGVTARNQIDTFKGTFTKDIVSQSKPNPTVELRLTPDELDGLYADLVKMHILGFASQFPPPKDRGMKNGTMVRVTPSQRYLLRIRVAGTEKIISWDDNANLMTPDAKALRAWFQKLRTIIQNKAEYKAMPPAEGRYL